MVSSKASEIFRFHLRACHDTGVKSIKVAPLVLVWTHDSVWSSVVGRNSICLILTVDSSVGVRSSITVPARYFLGFSRTQSASILLWPQLSSDLLVPSLSLWPSVVNECSLVGIPLLANVLSTAHVVDITTSLLEVLRIEIVPIILCH